MDFYEALESSIIKVTDGKNEIQLKSISIEKYMGKYFSAKKYINKLFINGIPIKKKWKITYTCLHGCGHINTILGKCMDRKIRNKTIRCYNCKEDNKKKQMKQSIFMKNNQCRKGIVHVPDKHKETVIDTIGKSIDHFLEEKYAFISDYYEKHLTWLEFENLTKKIIGIGNNIIIDWNDYMYVESFLIPNSIKYYPRLFCFSENKILKLERIQFRCDICENLLVSKNLLKIKKRYKILCKRCNLCNNIFKIRPIKNCKFKKIIYQSKLEKALIDFCNSNNIEIVNGPKIKYSLNNTVKKYYIDFYLPEYKFLIETKDRHIWHKRQIANGTWSSKKFAANKYARANNLTFMVIFPENMNTIQNILLSDKKI